MPGRTRRDRNRRRPLTVGPPMLLAAALAAFGALVGTGLTASADPPGGPGGDGLSARLAAQVRAVSDPDSPSYRHFLTPPQVAQYLPSGDGGGATGGLAQHLMRSQLVSAADAAAAIAEDGVSGPGVRSGSDPNGPPQPCSAYFGQVAASTYPAAFGRTAPYAVCGYTPAQLRSAYDVDDATGRGVTVAVLDAYGSPTMPQDANTYAARHRDKAFGADQYTQIVHPAAWTLQGACGGTASWAAEESLDIEAVHAMAPHAKVLYYGADSCQDTDLIAALTDIVRHRLADVVTASWGSPVHSIEGDESPEAIAQYDRLFQVAALEGITVDFSTGDCGDNAPTTACGGPDGQGSAEPQTLFPASDPWVTAVGGTSVEIGGAGLIGQQTAWGTQAWELGSGGQWQSKGWVYGGGGGAAADFAEPWYQRHAVPAAVSGALLTGATALSPRRTVPDLSLDADPFTGMLVGQTRALPGGGAGYAESAIGGTSLASPLLAGLEADAIQLGGRALGFVNPALYAPVHTLLLRDVTAPVLPETEIYPPIPGRSAVLVTLGDDGPLTATPGYDTATGLGSPGLDFDDRLSGT